MLTIEEIRIYPVKGLRGISIRETEVEPWGLRHDRRWMVIDPSGRFITQREVPGMAVIAAELLPGGLKLVAADATSCEASLPGSRAEVVDVVVWGDVVPARAASDHMSDWLRRVLGRPCRLVHMADPATARPTDPALSSPGDRVSFADGFPLLATTTGSLIDLNTRLACPVDMARFRPNLVIGGAEAWAEDDWSHVRVGNVAFAAVKDCARCVVTTVDQRTGLKAPDNEPLRTLSRFRRKQRGRIIFGQNLIPRGVGRIAVGDIFESLGLRPVLAAG